MGNETDKIPTHADLDKFFDEVKRIRKLMKGEINNEVIQTIINNHGWGKIISVEDVRIGLKKFDELEEFYNRFPMYRE